MMHKKKYLKPFQQELNRLMEEGNQLHKEQMKIYGQLRGFRKPISLLVHDELDGGESRQLNAFETNTYKMPR